MQGRRPGAADGSPDARFVAARRALVAGSAGFGVSVTACLAISHTSTTEHDGISYFSVRATTLPVIVLGYAAVIAGMLVAASRLPREDPGPPLALALRAMPILFLALLVTPFNHGTALDWTHMTLGVTLAIAQAAVTAWLCAIVPGPLVLGAAGLELAGGMLSALSMPDTSFNYLLQGELLFNLGFCLCLVAAVNEAATRWREQGSLDAWWARH